MSNSEKANTKSNGGNYARRPIEEIKAFKSKDGKYFVVQTIKTCILPINYVDTIIKNESPLKNGKSIEKEQ
ncbi:MAG: hypothetical protein HOO06_05140 [Bdellovibrionaceae bacterium]|jgi:hypothetical protein|nr:hypothetical protein [Pseudobdellovibrionaceae bacterium]